MSNAPKLRMKDIDLDQLTATVSEFAKSNDVPKLVHPSAEKAVEPAPVAAVATEPKVVPAKKKGPQPAPTKRTSFQLPDYLLKALSRRGIDDGCTMKYLVLNALRKDGYTVHDIDLMEDGRRG